MMTGPLRKGSPFMRNWFAIEAIPIYAVMGIAVGGAAWYLARLTRGPDVIWTKANPTPWNSIKPNETPKLLTINQPAEKKWSREKL